MKVSEILEKLNDARLAHLRWVARAEGLLAGLPLDKEQVPVMQTDCEFGRWYYGPGHVLNSMSAYRSLQEPHELLHKTYMQIFNLLYGEDERSMLGKLFGSAKKHKAQHLEEARKLLPSLKGQSEVLLKNIEILEKEIQTMAKRHTPNQTGSHLAASALMEAANKAEEDVRNLSA
jgi:hypothetical protein